MCPLVSTSDVKQTSVFSWPSYFPGQNSARLNRSQNRLVGQKLQGRTD
jgi:hypothetical protein